jgi:hypothetical protein
VEFAPTRRWDLPYRGTKRSRVHHHSRFSGELPESAIRKKRSPIEAGRFDFGRYQNL